MSEERVVVGHAFIGARELQALKEANEGLIRASEQLNADIQEMERKLNDIGPGVSMWCGDVVDDDGEPVGYPDKGWTFGYAKVGGSWRLAVRPVECTGPGDGAGDFKEGEAVPLLHINRKVRRLIYIYYPLIVRGLVYRARSLKEQLESVRGGNLDEDIE